MNVLVAGATGAIGVHSFLLWYLRVITFLE